MTRALARAARFRRFEGTAPEHVNIVPMLDMMVIILVFLLKSMSESSAAIPQHDDLRLPSARAQTDPAERGIVVTVSKSQILVGDQSVLELPTHGSVASEGAGASAKRGGAAELYIVPLGEALRRARVTDRAVRAAQGLDPKASEAVIVADRSTPYRLLVEVLYTLGQHEVGLYHLMVVQGRG